MKRQYPVVTKHDLVYDVAPKSPLTAKETKVVIEAFLDAIGKYLKEGRTIEIRNFGTFSTRMAKERMTPYGLIPPGIVPWFKFSQKLKATLGFRGGRVSR